MDKANNIKKTNHQGTLTLQFLFGFIIMISFALAFSVMVLVVVVSDITQYITYASSRHLMLAHDSEADQIKAAEDKYNFLIKEGSPFYHFFSGGLFHIDIPPGIGLNETYSSHSTGDVNFFYGVWTEFKAKILTIDLPFLGGGVDEEENYFTATIGSYLGREPSQEECENQVKKRWEWILDRHKKYGSADFGREDPKSSYEGVWQGVVDNGC